MCEGQSSMLSDHEDEFNQHVELHSIDADDW